MEKWFDDIHAESEKQKTAEDNEQNQQSTNEQVKTSTIKEEEQIINVQSSPTNLGTQETNIKEVTMLTTMM